MDWIQTGILRARCRRSLTSSACLRVPDVDEETLKKLPYWKQWLYKTLKEID